MGSCFSVSDTFEDDLKMRSQTLITLIEKNRQIKELEEEIKCLKRELSRKKPLLGSIPEEIAHESSSTQTE